MLTVELIYDTNCPNVKDARAQLLRAFAETGLQPHWQEWDHGAPESPPRVRAYGSPTILVNGQDIADASPSAGADCCRLYVDDGGRLRGVPSVEAITAALLRANETMSLATGAAVVQRSSWRSALAVLPALGTALLPNLTCPACWPAYAGLLSALGLGFANYTLYLLPLTAVFLTLAVASLGYHAKNRRTHKPFILGLLAAILIIVGKFVFVSNLAVYGGVALLVSASLWNSWPRRASKSGSCPACIPTGSHLITEM
jgi:mercuric ion transport protein